MPAAAGPYLRDTNSGGWALAGAIALNIATPTVTLQWWDLSNPPGPGGAPNNFTGAVPGQTVRGRGGAPSLTIVSVEGVFVGSWQVLISLADGQNWTPPLTPAGAASVLPAPILFSGSVPAWTYVPAGARFMAFNCASWTSGAMSCLLGGQLVTAAGL